MFNQLRQQSLSFWQRQTMRQRILLIALVALSIGAVTAFVIWASTPTYVVAYSGLSELDAGQIVEKLTADGVDYKLGDNGTILVQPAMVYEVRLSMARQGLPANSTVGYEIFSGTTLGMTDFTQRVNYQRALEGELERTIGSLEAIASVRVHIVTPEKALLASQQELTTASVTLAIKPNQALEQDQIQAIMHLLASSVEGLKPENVVVVDANGVMLSAMKTPDNSLNLSDARLAVETAYAEAIRNRVRLFLDNSLGPNKSVVQASVRMNWRQSVITTSAVSPADSTLRSQQVLSETFNGDAALAGGIPGAASNVPPLVAGNILSSGVGNGFYQRFETTSNFEFTQAERNDIVPPGQVERISVSVLADGITDTAQLATLRAAIADAAGIDLARGDSVSVGSLPFDRSYYDQATTTTAQQQMNDVYLKVGAAAAAALVAMLILVYVQRLLTNLRLAAAEAWTPVMLPAGAAAAGALGEGAAAPGLPGALAQAGQPALAAGQAAPGELPPGTPPAGAEAPAVLPALAALAAVPTQSEMQMSAEDEQLQKLMIQLAEENPATLADIIRLWLSEDDKNRD